MLESFGAFEFGGEDEDEGIEAGFVHTVHHLISAGSRGGVTFGYIPLVYMVCTASRLLL